MPPRMVIEIVSAIADALDYAHDSGVLHRYVNPGNILISKSPADRRTNCVDRLRCSAAEGAHNTLTRAGMFIGTAGYTAPEQLLGDELDGRGRPIRFGGQRFSPADRGTAVRTFQSVRGGQQAAQRSTAPTKRDPAGPDRIRRDLRPRAFARSRRQVPARSRLRQSARVERRYTVAHPRHIRITRGVHFPRGDRSARMPRRRRRSQRRSPTRWHQRRQPRQPLQPHLLRRPTCPRARRWLYPRCFTGQPRRRGSHVCRTYTARDADDVTDDESAPRRASAD